MAADRGCERRASAATIERKAGVGFNAGPGPLHGRAAASARHGALLDDDQIAELQHPVDRLRGGDRELDAAV